MNLEADSVKLEKYDIAWRKKFLREKNNLKKIFGDKAISIDHIGSTSIERMTSVPIIDIAIAVNKLSDFENFRENFIKSPYSIIEDSTPDEILIKRGPKNNINFFIHVMEYGSELYRNTIIFRDYIRSRKKTFRKYEKLKIKLAKKYTNDRKAYILAKGQFIQSVIKKSSKKNHKKDIITAIASICILFFIIYISNTLVSDKKDEDILQNESIPILSIQLNNVTLDQIHENDKRIKYPGNMVILQDGDHESTFSNVEIKGRGNSTWSGDKRPYQIKFDDKEDILGMGAAKKWVLLANRVDSSNIRNWLAFYIADLMDEEYSPKGRFINLYIDEQYKGIYYLTTKNEIGTNRIDIKDKLGVVTEMELFENRLEDSHIITKTYSNSTIILSDSVSKDSETSELAFSEFRQSFNKFEKCLKSKTSCSWDLLNQIIDTTSFAKYYIISEFSSNPDAYSTSFFFYKDGPNDVIHAGPIWDYDFAFGNTSHGYNPSSKILWATWIPNIFRSLLEYPEFQQEVRDIYQEKISNNSNEIIDAVDSMAQKMRDQIITNNDFWGRDDYDDSVSYLKQWVSERLTFLDLVFGQKPAFFLNGAYTISNAQLQYNYELIRFYDDFQIVQPSTQKALCVMSDDHESTAQVGFCEKNNSLSQRWKIVYNNNGYYIISKFNGLLLSNDEGELFAQELSEELESQRFKITKITNVTSM